MNGMQIIKLQENVGHGYYPIFKAFISTISFTVNQPSFNSEGRARIHRSCFHAYESCVLELLASTWNYLGLFGATWDYLGLQNPKILYCSNYVFGMSILKTPLTTFLK